MQCNLLPDSDDPDACVGHREVREARIRAQKPCKYLVLNILFQEQVNVKLMLSYLSTACSSDGFLCDTTRCIPLDWKCDGHLDCEDQTDEENCDARCPEGMVHCGESRCMNVSNVCDGIIDCPYGQDERNCSKYKYFQTLRNRPLKFESYINRFYSKTARENGRYWSRTPTGVQS